MANAAKATGKENLLCCVQCLRFRHHFWKFDAVQRNEPAPLCINCVSRSETRTCPACGKYLPGSEFTKTQTRKYGTLARCSACVKARIPHASSSIADHTESRYLYKITSTWSAADDTIN